jgi:hypothetical protein
MNSYISAHNTLCHRNHNDKRVYLSAEQETEDGSANEHDRLLLPCDAELHRNHFVHPFNIDSSDPDANRENVGIDPEQRPVCTRIYGTQHLHHYLPGKPISN